MKHNMYPNRYMLLSHVQRSKKSTDHNHVWRTILPVMRGLGPNTQQNNYVPPVRYNAELLPNEVHCSKKYLLIGGCRLNGLRGTSSLPFCQHPPIVASQEQLALTVLTHTILHLGNVGHHGNYLVWYHSTYDDVYPWYGESAQRFWWLNLNIYNMFQIEMVSTMDLHCIWNGEVNILYLVGMTMSEKHIVMQGKHF
jgi:hypothetical protein